MGSEVISLEASRRGTIERINGVPHSSQQDISTDRVESMRLTIKNPWGHTARTVLRIIRTLLGLEIGACWRRACHKEAREFSRPLVPTVRIRTGPQTQ